MGGGNWTSSTYASYSTSMGRTYDTVTCTLTDKTNSRQMFTQNNLHESLNVRNKIRECCDSAEHPNTLPVILALDVTGSMGEAAVKVSQSLNKIMMNSLETTNDVEFAIMAIGDLECDDVPIQMSQFESDIRIAESLDKVYFEYGGGGNTYESYSLAWYTALKHTELDCWKRNKKGIIITMGDENLNPYIKVGHNGSRRLYECLGDNEEIDIRTEDLYKEASEKFEIYHISVNDSDSCYRMHNRGNAVDNSFKKVLAEDHYQVATLDTLPGVIADIINKHSENNNPATISLFEGREVSW